MVAAHSIGAYVAVHAVRDVELQQAKFEVYDLRPPILKVLVHPRDSWLYNP